MGTVLGMLSKKIILPPQMAGANFSNAVGESALYKSAQRNLDLEINKKARFENELLAAKTTLNNYIAHYSTVNAAGGVATYDDQISHGDFNAAISQIVLGEKYGRADSVTWGEVVGNLKNSAPGGWIFLQNDWNVLVYDNGLSGGGAIMGFQRWLVEDWMKNQYRPKVQKLAAAIVDIQKKIDRVDENIIKYTKQRDAALLAEQTASDQRIKENMTDPAYIAAQAAAAQKKAMSRNILILGGLGILVVGGALLLRRRS